MCSHSRIDGLSLQMLHSIRRFGLQCVPISALHGQSLIIFLMKDGLFIPTSRFPWFKWKCMVSLQKTLISVGELNSVLSAFFFPIHLSYIWLVEFLVFKVQDWFWILILEMHYLGRWYRRPTYVCREKLNGYLWSFVDTKHSRHRDNRYTCEGFSVLPTCRYHLCSWFSFVLLSKILYKQLS